jgi:hypothetical protein
VFQRKTFDRYAGKRHIENPLDNSERPVIHPSRQSRCSTLPQVNAIAFRDEPW